MSLFTKNTDIIKKFNSCNYENFKIVNNYDNSDNVQAILLDKSEFNLIQYKKFKNLKVVGIIGNSLAKLDLSYFYNNNIVVLNTGNIYAKSCSEFLLMLCILGIRKASICSKSMEKGHWNRIKVKKSFYSGSIGILGYGFITNEFLKLLKPFNNKIKIFSENILESDKNRLINVPDLNVIFSNIDDILNSDIVIINRGLNDKTKKSFGKNEINKLNPGTVLINISRGEIIDTNSLYQRLLKNDIFACLDVFEKEPIDNTCPFINLKNVFLTPHLAGYSDQISVDNIKGIIDNVIDFLENDTKSNLITLNRSFTSHNKKY